MVESDELVETLRYGTDLYALTEEFEFVKSDVVVGNQSLRNVAFYDSYVSEKLGLEYGVDREYLGVEVQESQYYFTDLGQLHQRRVITQLAQVQLQLNPALLDFAVVPVK